MSADLGYGKDIMWWGDEDIHAFSTIASTVYHVNLSTIETFAEGERKHICISMETATAVDIVIDRSATTAMGTDEVWFETRKEGLPMFLGTIIAHAIGDPLGDFYIHLRTGGNSSLTLLILRDKNLVEAKNLHAKPTFVVA